MCAFYVFSAFFWKIHLKPYQKTVKICIKDIESRKYKHTHTHTKYKKNQKHKNIPKTQKIPTQKKSGLSEKKMAVLSRSLGFFFGGVCVCVFFFFFLLVFLVCVFFFFFWYFLFVFLSFLSFLIFLVFVDSFSYFFVFGNSRTSDSSPNYTR